MMISLQHLVNACQDVFSSESKRLQPLQQDGLWALPEKAIAHVLGKHLYGNKEKIFKQTNINWIWPEHELKADEASILFEYNTDKKQAGYFALQLKKTDAASNISSLFKWNKAEAEHKVRRFVCFMLKASDIELSAWTEKWLNLYPGQIKPVFSSLYSLAARGSDQQNWMMIWELELKPEKEASTDDIRQALGSAVQDMQYESMLNIVRKIIALRTNLEEQALQPELMLSTLYKMVFAREQGVQMEEVYDPEAMEGFTDSQLAAHNLLSDLQKTFGVEFDPMEAKTIQTLKDLAALIAVKKSF